MSEILFMTLTVRADTKTLSLGIPNIFWVSFAGAVMFSDVDTALVWYCRSNKAAVRQRETVLKYSRHIRIY
jgi:hypothetical protein